MLYGGSKDISLFQGLNEELVNKIIQTEVLYIRIDGSSTKANIYGESINKIYLPAVKLASLIEYPDNEEDNNNFGIDIKQRIRVRILRQNLIDANLVAQIGEIIYYDNNYYEINAKEEVQFIMGKNPQFSIAGSTHGANWSVILSCNMIKKVSQGLIKTIEDSVFA